MRGGIIIGGSSGTVVPVEGDEQGDHVPAGALSAHSFQCSRARSRLSGRIAGGALGRDETLEASRG